MVEFNIGSQQAGNITNVGGDAVIGRQHGVYHDEAVRVALDDLRRALTILPPDDRRIAEHMVDDVAHDLQRGDTEPAASRLQRLTEWLTDTGALATAGAALAAPLARLARLLGPAAEAILRHLTL